MTPSSGDRRQALCVLVVDDNPPSADQLGIGLRPHGFRPLLAHNGQAALALFRASGGDVHGAVVRAELASVATELRHLRPNLPCCLMVGDSLSAADLAAIPAGVAILRKPFTPARVAAVLQGLLGR